MQDHWRENRKENRTEGVAGWHDSEGRPYSVEMTTHYNIALPIVKW